MNDRSDNAAASDIARRSRPIEVLVLRAVDGKGGGADQIILRSAHHVDPNVCRMTLCFLRNRQDREFDFDQRARELGLNYIELRHRGAWDWTVKRQLRQVIQSVRPDLIHSHDYKMSFYAARVANCCGTSIPLLATAHGWTGHTWRERAIYYPADRRQLRQFAAVIAVSEEIRQTLVQHGCAPQRIHLLLNGIDPQEYQRNLEVRQAVRQELGLGQDEIVIGAVGRAEPQKRFDVMIDAFARLASERPRLRLLIAGDGSHLPRLQQMVHARKLAARITLLGHCPAMKRTYQAFDMVAQSSDYEGTPTVIVEAMALGIPIVATDVGGTTQLAYPDEHALIVPRRNPDALARAIAQTIDYPAATATRVATARARVESELNYEQRTRRLEAIYRAVM